MYKSFEGENGKLYKGEVILTESRLKVLAKKLSKVDEFAYDTETNTLRVQHKGEMSLVGISICFGVEDTYYIPTGHYFDDEQLSVKTVVKYLKPIFEREDVRIIGWNLKYDLHVLANVGIHIKTEDIFDGMIARWITDENESKSLKECTSNIYGVNQAHFDSCLATVTKEQKAELGLKANNKAQFWMVKLDVGAPYALADAYWTWRHYVDWQMDEINNEEMNTIFYKVQMPFLKTLYNMERRGVKINKARLEEMNKRAEKDLQDLEYKIIEIAGVKFNIGSSQQLSELLFGYKKVNKKGEFTGNVDILEKSFNYPIVAKTPSGAPKTGESELVALTRANYKRDVRKQEGIQMIKLILKYKRLNKLKSAFIEGLIKQCYDDGKVHPSFNQVGTDSGRLSCISKGTPIELVGGRKPIEEVVPGDLVYCYDDYGNLKASRVLKFMERGTKPCVKITWRSLGSHKLGTLICTPDHKIRMRDGNWLRADELKPKDRVTHLRKSEELRPRLYGLNRQVYREQEFIKSEIFKADSSMHIHHIDLNPSNNSLDNLQVMTHSEHTKLHSKLALEQGRIKYKHLYDGSSKKPNIWGRNNPNYKEYSKSDLEKLVIEAKGNISKIPMDFNTFKLKCKELDFNYKEVASKFNKKYNEPTREEFEESFMRNNGVAYKVRQELNIGRCKYDKLVKEYDICFNHAIVSVEPYMEMPVYDLEIETYHNFIASEICVHNCSEPNLQQLPRPIEFYEHKSLEEWAKDEGMDLDAKDYAEELESLEMKDGYPTGELVDDIECDSEFLMYLEYLKSWRAKSEDAIFWKFYEIRDCFITDTDDEYIIALD